MCCGLNRRRSRKNDRDRAIFAAKYIMLPVSGAGYK